MTEPRSTCPSCGSEIPGGVSFCGFCGARLDDAGNQPVSEPDFSTQAPTRLEPAAPRHKSAAAAAPVVSCPNCSAPNRSTDLQCTQCGFPLELAASAVPSPPVLKKAETQDAAVPEQPESDSWKSPFWNMVVVSFLMLPAFVLARWLLGVFGEFLISAGGGLVLAALLRNRCGLHTRRQFLGTAGYAALVWFSAALMGG